MPPVEGEQQRHLNILMWMGTALLLGLILIVVLLYYGWELPPRHIARYYATASGYASPPARGVAPAGTIPRGAPAPVPEGEDGTPNPLAADPQAIPLGRRAYQVNCAMCHGEPGAGIGPVGERYTPRPPDLAGHVPQHSDGTLYRQITEGIVSTPTPEASKYLPRDWHAFRNTTSPRERWAIVAYLKTVFGSK